VVQEITPDASDALQLAQTSVQSLFHTDRASQGLGLEIIDVAPGRVRIVMTVRPDMVNGHGMCHGGIYDVCVTKASGETVAHFRGRCSRLRVSTPQRNIQ
jgi:acyl-coenzyme A thioesterase PaaI-like protein